MCQKDRHVQIAKGLLARGLDDWVMAHEIVEYGILAKDEIVPSLSFQVAEYLLIRELMTAGDVTDAGFIPWLVSPNTAFETFKSRWEALDSLPTLGDVCWFKNTPKGDAIGDQPPRN